MRLCTLATREAVGAKRGESLIVLQVIAPFSRDICTVFGVHSRLYYYTFNTRHSSQFALYSYMLHTTYIEYIISNI
jgi:hypothetical protein